MLLFKKCFDYQKGLTFILLLFPGKDQIHYLNLQVFFIKFYTVFKNLFDA